jgi:hypothetical protein
VSVHAAVTGISREDDHYGHNYVEPWLSLQASDGCRRESLHPGEESTVTQSMSFMMRFRRGVQERISLEIFV